MKILVLASLLLAFVSLFSNLVHNQPFEHVQPDGTRLTLYVSGDEYCHRVHDEGGYTILKHPQTGYAVYAMPDGNSISASEYEAGRADPSRLGIAKGLKKNTAEAEHRRTERWKSIRDGNRTQSTGSHNNIVCFVNFPYQYYGSDPSYAEYDDLFNSNPDESLKGYYEEVSLNRLHFTSHLYPAPDFNGDVLSIQANHDRNYYLPYSYPDNQTGYTSETQGEDRLKNMIEDVVDELDALVPAYIDTDTDNPADGIVDGLVLVIVGAADAWGEILWPACWTFSTSRGEINGNEVKRCILLFESSFSPSVACHEMGHNIGFPDLYHGHSGDIWDDISPCGRWDLMNSDRCQHTLTYMKWKYGGWFPTINEITPTATPTQYELAAVTPSNPYPCAKIASSNPGQFYMLEYRKRAGTYEDGIPGSGLLVYRINTACGNGNIDGPPDEVYVYRPGGIVNTNGLPASAAFSADSSRTSFHNYTDPIPWLWVNDSTTPDGNLVLTNIGPLGGDVIHFTVQNFIPHIWNGSADYDWANPANWNQNSVPDSLDYVEIPDGCPHYPELVTSQSCYHLTVNNGAYVLVATATLTVKTDLINYGSLFLSYTDARLEVRRDLIFNSGSTVGIDAPATSATLAVQRNLEFHHGCQVDLSSGFIELFGTQHGYIRTYDPYIAINHLRSAKTGGFASGIGELSTEDLAIRGNIYVLNGSKFNHYYGGTTKLLGSFYAYSGSILVFTQGSLCMQGSVTKYLSISDPTNYLNNLTVYKSGTAQVRLSTDVDIRGNLLIQSGIFNTQSHNIVLGGAWTNMQGSGSFLEGTGTVSLTGFSDQHISSEQFYNLELNKPDGTMLVEAGTAVICTNYNWTQGNLTVSGGNFSAIDLTDEGIFGTVTLSDGLIELQQDSYQFCDLRGTLNISGGTLKLYGGMGTNYLSYEDTGTLNMSGGVLDYVHQGVAISASYPFNDNISGGTIRTSQSFYVYRTDFNPRGGTVELYSDSDATLHMTANPGSNFFNVTIDKSASRLVNTYPHISREPETGRISGLPSRSYSVIGSGLLDINGDFRLEAGTFSAPDLIRIAGSWINLAGTQNFVQGTGTQTVEFDGSGYQYCNYPEVFNILQLNKSASALRLNLPDANLSCFSYDWADGKIQVHDGVFTAHDLAQNGVYGDFDVADNGIINLHQDTGQAVDVNGFLSTEGGEINIFGGSGNSYLGNGGPGGFVMVGGVIDFKDNGITVQDVVDEFTFDLTQGAVLRLAGSWIDTRGDVCLDDCEVEMYGPADNTISSGTGSRFYDLTIDKAAANYAGVTTNLRIDGILTINNCTFLTGSGNTIIVGNGVCVYGLLSFGTGTQLRLAGGTDLTVFDGGILECVGSSTGYNYISHDASGYYNLNVLSGGSIGARYTCFEYLGTSGVNVQSGATVSTAYPFSYCTFRYGITGGTLLTLNNAQSLTVNNTSFTTNAGGGAHNAAKTSNQGTVVFDPYAGAFSGAAYENDPDSRLFWGTGIQKVPTPVITYDDNQNQIWLDWVYPIPFTSFKIYRSLSPLGPWSSHGTSTTTSWHETLPGPYYLYRVTAIGP